MNGGINYNQVHPSQFCQLPVTTSGKKQEENWSERFLVKVYIIVCYFSLIIFSTVELTYIYSEHGCAHYKYNFFLCVYCRHEAGPEGRCHISLIGN